MTAENFDHVLTRALTRRPFRPLTVELVGAHRHEVDHPRAGNLLHVLVVFMAPGSWPVYYDAGSVVRIVDTPAGSLLPGGEDCLRRVGRVVRRSFATYGAIRAILSTAVSPDFSGGTAVFCPLTAW